MKLVWSFLCKNMRSFYANTIEMCKTYTHSTCWTIHTMLCCLPSVLGVSLHDTIMQMKLSPLNAMGLNFNSLLPSDAISRYTSESTLAQVMTCCLKAPSDYWTNIDWLIVRFCDIHMRAISQRVPKLPFCVISLKIILLKLRPHIPGANAWIQLFLQHHDKHGAVINKLGWFFQYCTHLLARCVMIKL